MIRDSNRISRTECRGRLRPAGAAGGLRDRGTHCACVPIFVPISFLSFLFSSRVFLTSATPSYAFLVVSLETLSPRKRRRNVSGKKPKWVSLSSFDKEDERVVSWTTFGTHVDLSYFIRDNNGKFVRAILPFRLERNIVFILLAYLCSATVISLWHSMRKTMDVSRENRKLLRWHRRFGVGVTRYFPFLHTCFLINFLMILRK